MRWSLLSLVLLLALVPIRVAAQPVAQAGPPAGADDDTYLGVLFSAVPEAIHAQLPSLPRGQGVLVTHVLPGSPAAKAGLHRHDLLLGYDSEKIRDPEHLARLIRADKPERPVRLLLLRGGREMTVEVVLDKGPRLHIAQEARPPAGRDAGDLPRGRGKTGGPPAVSVSATPLADGNLKLTIEYYPDGASRPKVVTCSGSPAEIDREILRLPVRVQGLTRVALDRLRVLELQKGPKPAPPSAPKKR